MGNLAYGCSFSPKGPELEEFKNDILLPLFPEGSEHLNLKPVVRRLYWEAYTMASNEIARKSTRDDDEGVRPKKLPPAERSERLTELQKELGGLKLEGELEPSHLLIDKYVEMEDSEILKYVPWEELTKRNLELRGIKKDDFWREDSSGMLKRHSMEVEVGEPIKDLLHLRYALQRRGIAMNLARLLTFSEHEKLMNVYFEELGREPLDGYQATTIDQVKRTDREIFIRLAQRTKGGLPDAVDDKKLPLDGLLEEVMKEHRVTALLLPLQSSRSSGGDKRNSTSAELDRLKAEVKRLRTANTGGTPRLPNAGGIPSNKGKGRKGKGKEKRVSMPQELIGMSNSYKGQTICFDYNMAKGCQNKQCKRSHICCYPGCGGNHPVAQCPKK